MNDPRKDFTMRAAANGSRESVLAELHRRFPWAVVWWGPCTGTWWAAERGRHARSPLFEAASPAELARKLTKARPGTPIPIDPRHHDRQTPEPVGLVRYRQTGRLAAPMGTSGRTIGTSSLPAVGHRLPGQGLRGRLAELGHALLGGLVVRG